LPAIPEIPLRARGGLIRRQVLFLGKPVRTSAMPNPAANSRKNAIPRKNPETEAIFQANAWNNLQPTPNALSFRCSAERSMPTNSAVREMLPEKRLIWAIK
jgi:hypothetical protein